MTRQPCPLFLLFQSKPVRVLAHLQQRPRQEPHDRLPFPVRRRPRGEEGAGVVQVQAAEGGVVAEGREELRGVYVFV